MLDDYENIKNYKLIIISAHNEYWTRKGRRNFDKFIDEGGDPLILSGNTMWKQVRYEDDKVICFNQYYNDSLFRDSLRTSNYGLIYLKYPIESSIGLNFTKGGYGIQQDNGWNGYKIVGESILLKNTELAKGDILSVPSEECDGADLIFENENSKEIIKELISHSQKDQKLAQQNSIFFEAINTNSKPGKKSSQTQNVNYQLIQ